MTDIFITVIGAFLVLEGLFPLLLPRLWRDKMRELTAMRPGQIRTFGFILVFLGLLTLVIAKI